MAAVCMDCFETLKSQFLEVLSSSVFVREDQGIVVDASLTLMGANVNNIVGLF